MPVRRLISSTKSEIKRMKKEELQNSIRASEGRVILAQHYVGIEGLLNDVTNAELAQAFGADMVFFNGYSMDESCPLPGLIVEEYAIDGYIKKQYRIPEMKKLLNIPVGVYLECGTGDDKTTSTAADVQLVRPDRIASIENLRKVIEEGADFVVLGGNPGTGTSFETIIEATKHAKEILGDEILIFAGKWEDGVEEKVLGDPLANRPSKDVIKDLIDAGADVICLPIPGSRTGITVNMIHELVNYTHKYKHGTLAMSFLDGSIEGADTQTIRECVLMSKQTGADIHAIGDAGYSGVAVPENIYQMCITTKGRRLTYKRMAGSSR